MTVKIIIFVRVYYSDTRKLPVWEDVVITPTVQTCLFFVNSDWPVTVKMFEMWNNVSSKLEQVQQSQSQAQQPHTSSGSIKGTDDFYIVDLVNYFARKMSNWIIINIKINNTAI